MKHELSTTRRYLAACLPLLPAERLIRTRVRTGQPTPEPPFALVDKQRGAMRLVACDPVALTLGLTPGLALADARARIPELAVFDHDPLADHQWLERLADGCERYTPACMVDPPHGFVLDITGCAHRFGGDEAKLAANLKQWLHRLGVTSRIALGATPDSARAKARYAIDRIGDLPVEALDQIKAPVALRRAGLRTIGDLAARPRQPLTARFGKSCTVKLARLLEEEDPHITPRRRFPAICVERNFAEPVARTADVLTTINLLAGEAAGQLSERGDGGRRFEVSLFRSDGHVARLAVETGGATRDAALLIRLIRERIDTLADPLDPGFGYDLIRLTVPVAERLDPVQAGLETKLDREAEAAALIDRLSVRLSAERIRHFHVGNGHIPERGAYELSAQAGPPSVEWPKAAKDEPSLRPFRLFETPQPVEVIASVPDGPPRQFRWRKRWHQIVRNEGPERISAEWWRRKEGHEPGQWGPTRDYYRVEDSKGGRFWLFRHELHDDRPNPVWYLHGLFA